MSRPDKNFLSIADTRQVGDQVFGELVPDADDYSDTLKFSNAQNGTIRGERIVGGREDCVDCNRGCENLDIHFDSWEPRGKFVVTAKGGSADLRFSGTIERHAHEMDVDLGNGSDQSNERTKRVVLNMRMRDGSRVRVRVLNAWRPSFENGAHNYEVNDTWKGVFVYVWLLLRALHLT